MNQCLPNTLRARTNSCAKREIQKKRTKKANLDVFFCIFWIILVYITVVDLFQWADLLDFFSWTLGHGEPQRLWVPWHCFGDGRPGPVPPQGLDDRLKKDWDRINLGGNQHLIDFSIVPHLGSKKFGWTWGWLLILTWHYIRCGAQVWWLRWIITSRIMVYDSYIYVTILNGVYKLTYDSWAPHCMCVQWYAYDTTYMNIHKVVKSIVSNWVWWRHSVNSSKSKRESWGGPNWCLWKHEED